MNSWWPLRITYIYHWKARRYKLEETNADAGCHPEFSGELHNCPTGSNASIWSWVANVALQVIYTAECLARMRRARENGLEI